MVYLPRHLKLYKQSEEFLLYPRESIDFAKLRQKFITLSVSDLKANTLRMMWLLDETTRQIIFSSYDLKEDIINKFFLNVTGATIESLGDIDFIFEMLMSTLCNPSFHINVGNLKLDLPLDLLLEKDPVVEITKYLQNTYFSSTQLKDTFEIFLKIWIRETFGTLQKRDSLMKDFMIHGKLEISLDLQPCLEYLAKFCVSCVRMKRMRFKDISVYHLVAFITFAQETQNVKWFESAFQDIFVYTIPSHWKCPVKDRVPRDDTIVLKSEDQEFRIRVFKGYTFKLVFAKIIFFLLWISCPFRYNYKTNALKGKLHGFTSFYLNNIAHEIISKKDFSKPFVLRFQEE